MRPVTEYRLIAERHGKSEYYRIHEVVIEKGEPVSYNPIPVGLVDTKVEYMRERFEEIQSALDKPALWSGERFPKLYVRRKYKPRIKLEQCQDQQQK